MNMKNVIALVLAIVIAVATFGIAAANAEVGTEKYAEFYGISDYTYDFDWTESAATKNTVLIIPINKTIAHMDKGSKLIEYYTIENAGEWAKVAMAVLIEASTGYNFAIMVSDDNIVDYDLSDAEEALTAIGVICDYTYVWGYVVGSNGGDL